MKQLSKLGVRIFIALIASGVIAETLNVISGHPNQSAQDRNNKIGMVSGLILFAALTYFVNQYKKNK